ncbi:MAG: ABC transporter ATP-binding protein [Nitrososphaeria archaeon]|nr:ABC transporter ATP-binding protein [Nitrososphaeria archaeon]
MEILGVSDLNAGYYKIPVLSEVNLTVPEGSICAIVGPNGSGKSTLLKTIFGLTTVYSGRIKFNGKDITHLKPYEKVKLGMSYLPQTGNVFPNLTIRENMIMAGYLLSKKEIKERMEEVLKMFPIFNISMDKKVSTLSGGERQMLAMAMSLMNRPSLMMFDEPTANLSPKLAYQVFEKIEELNESGITIILVEQNVKRALEISDIAYLLVSGRVRFQGDSNELLGHPELGRLYLGIS